jgi:hypothetical protein
MSGIGMIEVKPSRIVLIRQLLLVRLPLDEMDGMMIDSWVPFRNEGAVVRCRIFIFPMLREMPPFTDHCGA